jgi:quinol monooxygenase YgiN
MSDTLSRRSIVTGGVVSAATLVAVAAGSSPAEADSESKGLRVIAELVAKPGSADDLRKELVPFAASSRKEPGCLKYVLLEVEKEPGRFLTYEIWTNRSALNAHMKTPALKALAPKLTPLLAKPFTQTFLDMISS